MQYERKYAWSVLLRLYHWAFALSITVLVVTGFYIHFPWTNTWLENTGQFPVAMMRYIHFIAGFVFFAAILARLYLLIFGNRQERIADFAPVTPRNLKSLAGTIKNYLYISKGHEERLGHNVLAGTAYIITFIAAAVQIISGFYMLYPENILIQSIGLSVAGPQQHARFIHYLLMWYFMLFALVHVYMAVWNDIVTGEGIISSIFNGHKFMRSR